MCFVQCHGWGCWTPAGIARNTSKGGMIWRLWWSCSRSPALRHRIRFATKVPTSLVILALSVPMACVDICQRQSNGTSQKANQYMLTGVCILKLYVKVPTGPTPPIDGDQSHHWPVPPLMRIPPLLRKPPASTEGWGVQLGVGQSCLAANIHHGPAEEYRMIWSPCLLQTSGKHGEGSFHQ